VALPGNSVSTAPGETINDLPIAGPERLYHWTPGRRPDDHAGLTELGL